MSRPVSRRIARYLRHRVRVRDGAVDIHRPRGGRARYLARAPEAPRPRRARRPSSFDPDVHDGLAVLELVIGTAIFVVFLGLAAAARLVW